MKLGEVLKLNKNSKIDIQDTEHYRIAGVQNYGQGIVIRRQVFGSELTMKQYQVIAKNQLMWCKVDTKNGAFGLTQDEHIGSLASSNMALADIDSEKVVPEFLEILFRQKPFADYITNLSSGSTNRKYLTPSQLFDLVELPDLNLDEQKSFITRLRSVMKLNINSRIQQNKSLLSQLQQKILSDAIKGELTYEWRKHNPDAEPAIELLKHIKAERAQLVKDKKIRKEKPLPPIAKDEIPFELPEGWVWCRLGLVTQFVSGNNFASTDFQKGEGIKCIKITNAGVGEIIETDDVLPYGFDEKYPNYLVFEGDIVIALTRPYIAAGLKVSICPAAYDYSLLNQRVALVRPYEGVMNRYAYLFLQSDYVLNGYKSEFDSKGQQPNLKKDHVTHLLFPLPPESEQKAIVQKVESLLIKCKELELAISQSEQDVQILMQAVLKEAFESKKEEVYES